MPKNLHGKKIKICNRVYTLRIEDEIEEGTLVGICRPDRQTITIVSFLTKEGFKDTLLHEILHAIWYGQGVDSGVKSEDIEEYVVGVFAANLMQVFQDNKWIREVLWK